MDARNKSGHDDMGRALTLFGPGIDERHTRRLEVRAVAGDDRHPVHRCRGGDQRIPFGARIGHVQSGAFQRDGGIDRQGAFLEFGEDVAVHPTPQQCPLAGVAPLDAQDADLQFPQGQGRDVEARCVLRGNPCADTGIGPAVAGLAQFGDGIRVQQKRQERSAAGLSMLARGGSNSISASPGMESASSRLRGLPASRR